MKQILSSIQRFLAYILTGVFDFISENRLTIIVMLLITLLITYFLWQQLIDLLEQWWSLCHCATQTRI